MFRLEKVIYFLGVNYVKVHCTYISLDSSDYKAFRSTTLRLYKTHRVYYPEISEDRLRRIKNSKFIQILSNNNPILYLFERTCKCIYIYCMTNFNKKILSELKQKITVPFVIVYSSIVSSKCFHSMNCRRNAKIILNSELDVKTRYLVYKLRDIQQARETLETVPPLKCERRRPKRRVNFVLPKKCQPWKSKTVHKTDVVREKKKKQTSSFNDWKMASYLLDLGRTNIICQRNIHYRSNFKNWATVMRNYPEGYKNNLSVINEDDESSLKIKNKYKHFDVNNCIEDSRDTEFKCIQNRNLPSSSHYSSNDKNIVATNSDYSTKNNSYLSPASVVKKLLDNKYQSASRSFYRSIKDNSTDKNSNEEDTVKELDLKNETQKAIETKQADNNQLNKKAFTSNKQSEIEYLDDNSVEKPSNQKVVRFNSVLRDYLDENFGTVNVVGAVPINNRKSFQIKNFLSNLSKSVEAMKQGAQMSADKTTKRRHNKLEDYFYKFLNNNGVNAGTGWFNNLIRLETISKKPQAQLCSNIKSEETNINLLPKEDKSSEIDLENTLNSFYSPSTIMENMLPKKYVTHRDESNTTHKEPVEDQQHKNTTDDYSYNFMNVKDQYKSNNNNKNNENNNEENSIINNLVATQCNTHYKKEQTDSANAWEEDVEKEKLQNWYSNSKQPEGDCYRNIKSRNNRFDSEPNKANLTLHNINPDLKNNQETTSTISSVQRLEEDLDTKDSNPMSKLKAIAFLNRLEHNIHVLNKFISGTKEQDSLPSVEHTSLSPKPEDLKIDNSLDNHGIHNEKTLEPSPIEHSPDNRYHLKKRLSNNLSRNNAHKKENTSASFSDSVKKKYTNYKVGYTENPKSLSRRYSQPTFKNKFVIKRRMRALKENNNVEKLLSNTTKYQPELYEEMHKIDFTNQQKNLACYPVSLDKVKQSLRRKNQQEIGFKNISIVDEIKFKKYISLLDHKLSLKNIKQEKKHVDNSTPNVNSSDLHGSRRQKYIGISKIKAKYDLRANKSEAKRGLLDGMFKMDTSRKLEVIHSKDPDLLSNTSVTQHNIKQQSVNVSKPKRKSTNSCRDFYKMYTHKNAHLDNPEKTDKHVDRMTFKSLDNKNNAFTNTENRENCPKLKPKFLDTEVAKKKANKHKSFKKLGYNETLKKLEQLGQVSSNLSDSLVKEISLEENFEENIKKYQLRKTDYVMRFNSKINGPNENDEKLDMHFIDSMNDTKFRKIQAKTNT